MGDLEVQYLQVQTTTDSRAEAMELSRAAVEARLAACAQVAGPVASVYWWDGGLERAEEWLVLLKLPVDRYAQLRRAGDHRAAHRDRIRAVPGLDPGRNPARGRSPGLT
jgi:uncharacterized protein involved in tolerance to divalent cations